MTDFPGTPKRCLHILEASACAPSPRKQGNIYASIGQEIKCDKDIFDSYSYEGWKDIHHDLLIVCAAAEYADRRWARSTLRWARSFHVTIPVLRLDTWLNASVQRNLRDTLRHLTGDEWQFTFVQNESHESNKPRQRPLFPKQHKEFAIAYSEGLDSLCVSQLYNESDAAVCVRVSKHRQHRRKGERPFDRLPFDVSVKPSPEDSARSRGFKFAAITAIAADLSKVRRIIVPESGQGALGPILLPLQNIYPDYRNHPTFFRKMERFIESLLEIRVEYEQPRIWHTKGQTISAFLAKPGTNVEQVINTRSCWQQRFNVRVGAQLRQCGICAACLLRRMSLHTAGIEEPAEQYAVSNLKAGRFADALPKQSNFKATSTLYDYGYMGARHLQQLGDLAREPDPVLKPHAYELAAALGIPIQEAQERLRDMLHCHSKEWEEFAVAHGDQSFLTLWTKGGRRG